MTTEIKTPITFLEESLWFEIERDPVLSTLVKVGNRLTFLLDKQRIEKQAQEAGDAPEIAVIPSGGVINESGKGTTSNTWNVQQRFLIGVTTDEKRLNAGERCAAPVKWAMIRLASRLQRKGNEIKRLVPSAESVLVNQPILFSDDPKSDQQQPVRVISGWLFGFEISYTLVFPSSEND